MVWLLMSVTALAASGILARVYYRSWQRIQSAPRLPIGEPVRIPAWANLRRELLRMLALLLFVLAGCVSLTNAMLGPLEYARLLTILCLIAGQVVIAFNAWADWRDDRRLIAAVNAWDQRYVAVPKDGRPA